MEFPYIHNVVATKPAPEAHRELIVYLYISPYFISVFHFYYQTAKLQLFPHSAKCFSAPVDNFSDNFFFAPTTPCPCDS